MKKGSLSLAINAIVVLILAITMLGLGLTFMKKTFGGVTEQFETVSEEMEREMTERMKEATSRVMLNVYEVDMKRSDQKSVFLAIKNNLGAAGKVKYLIAKGTCAPFGATGDCDAITMATLAAKDIPSGEIAVLPVKLSTTSDIVPDTYLYPIVVTDPDGGKETADLYITIR